MRRFIGLFLTIFGGGLTLWAGIYVLTGQSGAMLTLTPDYSLTAMTGGLIGVAVFTTGLIWMRE